MVEDPADDTTRYGSPGADDSVDGATGEFAENVETVEQDVFIEYRGFLGLSDIPGCRRLYSDGEFSGFTDIRADDIGREESAAGEMARVYVRKGAIVVRGKVEIVGAEARFLTGPLSDQAPWIPSREPPCPPGLVSPRATPAGFACC